VDDTPPVLRPGSLTLRLLAIVCGLCAANLYYLQPLAPSVAADLGVAADAITPGVAAAQVGYAAALLLIVPLGDTADRRRLVTVLLVAAAILLAVLPFTSGAVFILILGAIGVATVSGMVIVPWVADLAAPDQRGRMTGTVMSGLIMGVLLCRTFAGLLDAVAGWRSVYWTSAVLMIVCLVIVRRLPVAPRRAGLPYTRLLASVVRIAREQRRIVERAVYGALSFGAFSVFWTATPLLLSGPGFGFGSAGIGLLSLLAAGGAAGASIAGRFADHGHQSRVTAVGFALILAAFAVVGLMPLSLLLVAAGILVLDFGVQACHITNQSVIYEVAGAGRSRATTVYMTFYFVGGASGSAMAGLVWPWGGWLAICVVGGAYMVVALLVMLTITAVGSRRAGALR
jgi:predicted MFS family arabinose efflux permease